MSLTRGALILLGLLSYVGGCAVNAHVQVHRLENGLLQVKGPLAGPFVKLEDLAAGACELMTQESGASNGLYGSEYCALYYYAPTEKAFFLSYLSDIRSHLDSAVKSCELPRSIDDPGHPVASSSGAHTRTRTAGSSRHGISASQHNGTPPASSTKPPASSSIGAC